VIPINRTVITITRNANTPQREILSCRLGAWVTAQTNIVSRMERVGSQKSRLRIGVEGCSQKMASRLATNISQFRQAFGAISPISRAVALVTRIGVIVNYTIPRING